MQEKPEECKLKAEKGDQVKVHYRGTLEDGEPARRAGARGWISFRYRK